MAEFSILATCSLGNAALECFTGHENIRVDVEEIKDEGVLARRIGGYHGLIVRSNVKVTGEVFAKADKLLIVGRAGIGVDNIDLEAATHNGVAVVNAPSGNIVTTAEHALALLMSLARNVPQANSSMKENKWEKKKFLGRELRAKTLGIIGIGRIGSAVAERALGLKMKVAAFDPYLTAERAAKMGLEKVSLDELLEKADFITVHTPLTEETKDLLNDEAFAKCKDGVMLVNCARGGIVEEESLLGALESGKVAGAALDVYRKEPPEPHPLYDRSDVIMTPHLGASTREAQESVAIEVAENIVCYLENSTAPNLLNAPTTSPELLGTLAPYLKLSEKTGLFIAQLLEGGIEEVHITCWGEAMVDGKDFIAAAFLKGLLTPMLSDRVNLVNAPAVAGDRGINIVTSTNSETKDFSDLLTVKVSGPWGSHTLEGALFGRGEPRLVNLDGFKLDAIPEGNVILISNDDVPGVIGSIGTCLGSHSVNIAGLYNGRTAVGGEALSLVNVDEKVTDEVLEDLRKIGSITSVKSINL